MDEINVATIFSKRTALMFIWRIRSKPCLSLYAFFRWKFLHLALKQKAVYFLVTNSFLFCFCILRAFETYIFLSVSFGKQNKKGYCSQKEVSVVRCGNLHVVKKSFQTFIHTCLVSRPTEVTLWRKSATRTCLDTWQEHIFR